MLLMVDVLTSDPGTVIEDQFIDLIDPTKSWVIYHDLKSGERWRIDGTCNMCGLCEVGRVDDGKITFNKLMKIGEADASNDLTFKSRLDVPVRPDIKQNSIDQRNQMLARKVKGVSVTGECTLSGEYL